MKAVFEELEGNIATFVLDDFPKTFTISIEKLPPSAKIGDVFKVKMTKNEEIEIIKKLPEERQEREQSAKEKRERLLNRSKKE